MKFAYVLEEIHKWFDELTRSERCPKYEIAKNEKELFLVQFETGRFLAELTVDNNGYHPYRFVLFMALDVTKDVSQKPYIYADEEGSDIKDIVENLNNAINYIMDC